MSNRRRISPIFFVTFLGLGLGSALVSRAEPGVPAETTNAPSSAPAVTAPPTPSAPSTSSAPVPAAMPVDSGTTYTVKKGDTLTSIAHKFHVKISALKELNGLTTDDLKLKQVLKIPVSSSKKAKTAKAPTTPVQPSAVIIPKKSSAKAYTMAPPGQDIDVPASTFASCPVPVTSDDDSHSTASFAPASNTKAAPVAQLVSPDELTEDEASHIPAKPAPSPFIHHTATPPPSPVAQITPEEDVAPAPTASLTYTTSASKQFNRNPSTLTASMPSPSNSELSSRFLLQARALGGMGISYNESWRPPSESKSWVMDCSNTSRYLYKVTTGIQLPRTASDQYYYLHQQNKAWDVPDAANGYADCNYLRKNLKIGDLLFWENTYRPERQPPITHVMIFLGTNEKGEWIMAGSQSSRGGEHNRRRGGPDIYVFDPTRSSGGYTTWLGLVHHKGRFCAFGRPLEADAAKLAMVANN